MRVSTSKAAGVSSWRGVTHVAPGSTKCVALGSLAGLLEDLEHVLRFATDDHNQPIPFEPGLDHQAQIAILPSAADDQRDTAIHFLAQIRHANDMHQTARVLHRVDELRKVWDRRSPSSTARCTSWSGIRSRTSLPESL